MGRVRVGEDTEQSAEDVLDVDDEVLGIIAGGGKICLVLDLLGDPGVKTEDVLGSGEANRSLAGIAPLVLEGGAAVHASAGLGGADGAETAVQDRRELEEVDGVG